MTDFSISTLPTAEPQPRTTVPGPKAFTDDSEYLTAPELKEIGERLIADVSALGWIGDEEIKIAYLWKKDGGFSLGRIRMAQVQKTSKLLKHFVPQDYIIWLAANYHGGNIEGNKEVERSVFHELCHFYGETTKKGLRITLQGHDKEYFMAEVARYGQEVVDRMAPLKEELESGNAE